MKHLFFLLSLLFCLPFFTPVRANAQDATCDTFEIVYDPDIIGKLGLHLDGCSATDYTIRVTDPETGLSDKYDIQFPGHSFTFWFPPKYTDPNKSFYLELINNGSTTQSLVFSLAQYLYDDGNGDNNNGNQTSLITCTTEGKLGINTAIGCIPIETPTLFSKFFILWSISISGATGLIMFAYSAYLIMIGARDPRRKLLGKDIFWSTLSGFILLILSLYFLNAIGIGILGLVQIGT